MKRARAARLPRRLRLAIGVAICASPFVPPATRAFFPGQLDHVRFVMGAGIATLFLYLVVRDLLDGEIRATRYGVTMVVRRRKNPVSFWALGCMILLVASIFALLALGQLHADWCCDPRTVKRLIDYAASAGLAALCIHLLEATYEDLKGRDVGRGMMDRATAPRAASPTRYWISIAAKLVAVAVFAGLLVASILARS